MARPLLLSDPPNSRTMLIQLSNHQIKQTRVKSNYIPIILHQHSIFKKSVISVSLCSVLYVIIYKLGGSAEAVQCPKCELCAAWVLLSRKLSSSGQCPHSVQGSGCHRAGGSFVVVNYEGNAAP